MKTTQLKTKFILILALVAISVSSFAQDKDSKTNKSPEERAKVSTERMKTSLNLTDEQYSKIYDLNLQMIKDRKDFKESKSKLDGERKKKSSEYRNSMKNILTEEQFKNMKKVHKDKKFKKGMRIKKEHRNNRSR